MEAVVSRGEAACHKRLIESDEAYECVAGAPSRAAVWGSCSERMLLTESERLHDRCREPQ